MGVPESKSVRRRTKVYRTRSVATAAWAGFSPALGAVFGKQATADAFSAAWF